MDVFCEIPCLTENSKQFNGIVLQKKWFKSADKRVIGQYLQKFINYNSKHFKFLDVQPLIVGTDQNVSIAFRTSRFIGSIPLRAPDTGKQIGDFVVTPRFSGYNRYEDYIEILNLLDTEISPDILDSLPLASGKNFRPPLYLEAVKYIKSLESLIKLNWRKFDNIEKISEEPTGKINWQKYSKLEYKVENRLKFPVSKNILSEFHPEYSELRFVFDICKKEILSANTPIRIKTNLRSRLYFLEEKLYYHQPKYSTNISIKFSDNPTITKCKQQANKILNFNLLDSTAWKVDFSDVFEKFVQHIFKLVAKEVGGQLFTNYKLNAYSKKFYSWELKHIEPDAIYQKKSLLVFIDAKYKSNLYNKFGDSENLKDDHRHDLHQIMAYSSFSKTIAKNGILCYPSEKLESKTIEYRNRINEVSNLITIIGIPLKKEIVHQTKTLLMSEIHAIEKSYSN